LSLDLSVIAQITENLQFVAAGWITYLPLNNQVGFLNNSYNYLDLYLLATPLFLTQVAYDTMIAGWPVTFSDRLEVNTARYVDSAVDNFELFRGDFLTRDESGGYILRSSGNGRNNTASANDNNNNYDGLQVYLSNLVSASTDRLLPSDIHLHLEADHENFWFDNANGNLPPSTDEFYAEARTERPDMRFNLFLNYSASYIEDYTGLTQQIHAGVYGPIDDQLNLSADVGYYFGDNGHSGGLYSIFLSHDAGPYTQEFLGISRTLSAFNDFVVSSQYYNLRQILGPTLNATVFLEHGSTDDLIDGGDSSQEQEQGGVELDWTLGPKTILYLYGIAERQDFGGGGGRTDTITGRGILNRVISDDLTLQLLYQYQRATSSHADESYYENLVYLRVIYSFE
jgi:hypothetical protein